MKKAVIIMGVLLLIIILLLITVLILKPKQASVPRKLSTEQQLDQYLTELTESKTPPSLSISVISEGEWVYRKAFGTADEPMGIPARTDTIYPWFSATKLFTSLAVLKLVDEGSLELSDPLGKFLPEYNTVNKENEAVSISIQDLLNHQSGLPDIIPEGLNWLHFEAEDAVSQSAFFEQRIKEDYRVVNFTPGSDVQYSNTGYIILGVIIEKISGLSYEDYIIETILTPLQLESTGFKRTVEQQNKTATGSQHNINIFTLLLKIYGDRGLMKRLVREKLENRMWFVPVYTDYTPSTGLSGTSENLARFGYFLMEAEGFEGQTISDTELINEMQRPYTLHELEKNYRKIKQFGYGLKTWKINKMRVYGHSGGGPGYSALLAFIPEKNLVVAVNANDTGLDTQEILQAVSGIDW